MILLLGATGYLGQAFSAEMRRRGIPFSPLTRSAIDYTRFDVLFNLVRSQKPRFIINAAGFTGRPNLDSCEAHRAEAVQANTLLPQTIGRVCYLTKTPWGHVSSGCIFSGAKVSHNGGARIERDLNRSEVRRLYETHPEQFHGFDESDEPNFTFRTPPCSFYSGTKALAEEGLRWFEHTYLWRPRIVFDELNHPRNYLSRIQEYTQIQDNLSSFTHRGDFVRACLDLWEAGAPYGPYHIVNPGAISTKGIAQMIQRILRPEKQFEFWKDDEEFYRSGARAPRPGGILDSSRLRAAGIQLRPLREALEDSITRWQTVAPQREWLNSAKLS